MNEIDIQVPKKRKTIKPNKYLVNICNRKKESRGEAYTNKKTEVWGSLLNKASLKVKEAKKIMNNVVTIERNKLFDSKFDACKDNLKSIFKIVNQLLNKSQYSMLPSHTNRKILV